MSAVSGRKGGRARGGAVLAILLLTSGCAGGAGAPARPATVRLEPAARPAPPAAEPPLPALPVARTGGGTSAERRVSDLDVVDQDLRLVVRSLAESFGLDYHLDPAVSGRVTTHLKDVTLEEALDALVLPGGFEYQVQGRVLRVVPARLQTRIFTLDYISLSRAGIGTTVVQRRLGNTQGGFNQGGLGGGIGNTGGGIGQAGLAGGGLGGGLGGIGGGISGGADIIQSVSVADLWEEIRVSLDGLIFSAPPAGTAPNDPTQRTGSMEAAQAPSAFSRVDEGGRRLIINPLSGTILVAAEAAKLAEVQMLLAAIEGSVQRQVLIEAKIVEVTLDEEFEFGIDWSLVRQVGSVDLRLNLGGGTGAQFTLADADQAEREISLVLTALEQQGEVSVLSSPRVSVMNNQRAVINVATDEIFFSVTRQPILGPTGIPIGFNTQIAPQQISVGIVLDVFPQIAPDNTITMNVRPVITDVVRVDSIRLEDGTQASAPVIDRRETDTVVRVRGGETVVIGGLMQTRREDSSGGVPGLRRIPLIGRLFEGRRQSTEKRELVIFITPRIVAGQPPIG